MVEYHHVIIGGGINGLCTAYQLARRGARVLILEKFPLPHSRGSSHGQSRGIRRAYPDPYFTRLMETAYKEWHEIEQKTGVTLIKETGLLTFSKDDNNQFIHSIINSFKHNPGAESEALTTDQLSKKFPYINFGGKGVGCYDPSGGVIMADKAIKCVQALCEELGVDIRDGEGAEEILHDQVSVTVKTSLGNSYVAESCVICAGPWAGPLLRQLGYKLPLQPIKIPVYYWRAKTFLPHTWIYEGKDSVEEAVHYWGLPELEYPGFAKICSHHGPNINPDERDSVSTEHIKRELTQFIRTTFPGVTPEVGVEESCIYTVTPDWNPIIDTLPTIKNIVVGVGFSGTGFKLGPVTGTMLADLAQGVKKRQDVPTLSIDRFKNSKM